MTKITTYVTRGQIVESFHESKCVVKNYNYKTIFTIYIMMFSGLAKEIRAQAATGESTEQPLSGYTQDRTVSLINDCFGTPQELPADV